MIRIKSTPLEIVRRAVPLETLAVEDEGGIKGYGSVFNNVDWYKEIIAPGAFEKTLAAHAKAGTMPAMLWQHWTDQVPGVWKGMSEDKRGLKVEGEFILDTQLGKEAHVLTKRKAVNGLSIGFVPKKSQTDEESGIVTLTEVELWEVSVVTFPANTKARIVEVKSMPRTVREFEDFLRDVGGYSVAQAKSIASRGFKAADEARDEPSALAELSQLIIRNTSIIQ